MIIDILLILALAGLSIKVYRQSDKIKSLSADNFEYTDMQVTELANAMESRYRTIKNNLTALNTIAELINGQGKGSKAKAGRAGKRANKTADRVSKDNGRKK